MANDLLQLPTHRALLSLAWPLVVLGLLRTATLLVDAWWIGFLGTDALSALAACAFAVWILHTLTELAGTGTQAVTAQALGARAPRERLRALGAQGVLVSGIVTGGCLLLRMTQGAYFDALALEGEPRILGLAYLDASLLGSGAVMVQGALVGVYRGIGDTRGAMWVSGVSLAANALLDPLFIFTLKGHMAGAAWATVGAYGLSGAAAWWDLHRRGLAPWGAAPASGPRAHHRCRHSLGRPRDRLQSRLCRPWARPRPLRHRAAGGPGTRTPHRVHALPVLRGLRARRHDLGRAVHRIRRSS